MSAFTHSATFRLSSASAEASTPVDPDEPLRIAILGNFSGRNGNEPRAASRPLKIDCDIFENVFARIAPSVLLPETAGGKITFQSLDDFHPDRLVQRIDSLERLARLRRRLLNPASAPEASAEALQLFGSAGPASEQGSAPPAAAGAESTDDLLGRLMGKPVAEPKKTTPASAIDQLIRQIAAPTSAPTVSPEHQQLAERAALELTKQLRAVLHSRDFQKLEAVWRGVDFLVRNFDEEVELHLLDVTAHELCGDGANAAATTLARTLEEVRPRVVVADFFHGAGDVDTLRILARVAAGAGAMAFAGAMPELVGCESFATQPHHEDWQRSSAQRDEFEAFRRSPEAQAIGLTLPRFLLRLPYSASGESIDAFPFEELPGSDAHEQYLWGNSAFLCAYLLSEAHCAAMQGASPENRNGVVHGLPVHTFLRDGGKEVKPCAEAWLNERAADAILRGGLIPVLSVRNADAVQVIGLGSIARGATAPA